MQRLLASLSAVPFPVHWLLVLLMAVVIPILTARTDKPGEFYPFSNFPMYSTFEPATYYVFVTDAAGNPVKMGPLFARAPSDVKKVFDRKLNDAKKAAGGKVRKADLPPEVRAKAAEDVLRWLEENAPDRAAIKAMGGLQLHRVDIRYVDGKVAETTNLEGAITLP